MKGTRSRATAPAETLAFGARKVVVTHPDRILFPSNQGPSNEGPSNEGPSNEGPSNEGPSNEGPSSDPITKGELVHYYRDVAHWLLPYLADRPLTLQRWPNGIDGFSFFEKQAPKGMPEWIATTTQPRADGSGDVTYPLAADAPSLAWFANLAAITFHVWMSRVGAIGNPDFLLFDLDPFEGCTVRTLARVALTVRDELEAVGLTTLVKTTGGKGLHVLAPLAPRYSYAQARAMNEVVAHRVAALLPDEVTLERSKSKRAHGSLYFDWAQLGLGRTLVPPYVVRGRAGAPVSMPIAWAEVETMSASRSKAPAQESFARWNLRTVPPLLAGSGDPWRDSFGRAQKLEPALDKARSLWGKGSAAGRASKTSKARSKTTKEE
jgi:bifunctional non-homologous end joining protein LigD